MKFLKLNWILSLLFKQGYIIITTYTVDGAFNNMKQQDTEQNISSSTIQPIQNRIYTCIDRAGIDTFDEQYGVSKSNIELTYRMYDALVDSNITEVEEEVSRVNLIFSPFSLQSVMGAILLGSGNNTANEIRQNIFPTNAQNTNIHQGINSILNRLTKHKSNAALVQANGVYVKKGHAISHPFLAGTQRCYHFTSFEVDFQNESVGRTQINQWIQNKTKDKIPSLIPEGSLRKHTTILLSSAIYFHGEWEQRFDPKNTKMEIFTTTRIIGNGTFRTAKLNISMMTQTGMFSLCDLTQIDARVLTMKYSENGLRMIIILPNHENGVENVEDNLSVVFEHCLTEEALKSQMSVQVSLPKFKLKSYWELLEPLQRLGVKDVFDEKAADLSGLHEKKDLHVDRIIQVAIVDVDETGLNSQVSNTVAKVGEGNSSEIFNCNHPFMFMIAENSSNYFGPVIFIGQVFDPNDELQWMEWDDDDSVKPVMPPHETGSGYRNLIKSYMVFIIEISFLFIS